MRFYFSSSFISVDGRLLVIFVVVAIGVILQNSNVLSFVFHLHFEFSLCTHKIERVFLHILLFLFVCLFFFRIYLNIHGMSDGILVG